MSWKRPSVKERMSELLKPLPLVSNGYWLDIGTGSGVFAELIEDRYESSQVIQIDKNSFNKKTDLFFKADLQSLPLRRKSIKGMVCAQVLHYIPPRYLSDVFTKFNNVLEQNGLILVIEYLRGDRYPWVPYFISPKHLEKTIADTENLEYVDIHHDKDKSRPKFAVMISSN